MKFLNSCYSITKDTGKQHNKTLNQEDEINTCVGPILRSHVNRKPIVLEINKTIDISCKQQIEKKNCDQLPIERRSICILCDKEFRNVKSLRTHNSKFHPQKTKRYICSLCNYSSTMYLYVVNHTMKKHNKEHQYKTTKNITEFEAMNCLTHLKNDGFYSFKQTTGPKELAVGKILYFTCSINKEDIECYCFIKCTLNGRKSKIIYCNNHPHQPNLDSLRIKFDTKEKIYKSLIEGVPVQKIHENLTANLNIEYIKKENIITKNYIRMIRNKLDTTTKYFVNDFKNCAATLNSLRISSGISYSVFKEKNECVIAFPNITPHFILAFQTNNQKLSLQKEQPEYLMVDSTHATNTYNFPLITFSVLTKKQRFLPILWIISDSDSERVVSYVLSKFKDQNLLPFTPRIIMSDMSPVYYNSWRLVMNPDIIWHYCSWHFKTAVLTKLICKVKFEDIVKKIKLKFRAVCDAVTEETFKKKYKDMLYYISIKAIDFHEYFVRYYDPHKPRWAAYARRDSEINTNMFAESFHNTLKSDYLIRKSNHRLDFLLSRLRLYDNTRAYNHFNSDISSNLEFQGYREKMANTNHKKSLTLEFKKFRRRNKKIYYKNYVISIGKCGGCSEECAILCRMCSICKDRYTCTCLSFLVKKEMCKHIHKAHYIFKSDTKEIKNKGIYNIVKNKLGLTEERIPINKTTYISQNKQIVQFEQNRDNNTMNMDAATGNPKHNEPKYEMNKDGVVFPTIDYNLSQFTVYKSYEENNKNHNIEENGQGNCPDYVETTPNEEKKIQDKLDNIKKSCNKLLDNVEKSASLKFATKMEQHMKIIELLDSGSLCENNVRELQDDDMLTKQLPQRNKFKTFRKSK